MADAVEVIDLELRRLELVAGLETSGNLDPTCRQCEVDYAYYLSRWTPKDTGSMSPMHPAHKAAPNCKSGKRAHCSCGVCF